MLTPADWDQWKSINAPALSSDGKWAVYTLLPQLGDGELVIRSTSGNTEFRVPRGYLSRANNTPGGLRNAGATNGEEDPAGPTASPAQITSDSRFVLVSTQANRAEVERAPRGRGAAATNRQSLVIVSLPDGKTTTIAGVRSFRLRARQRQVGRLRARARLGVGRLDVARGGRLPAAVVAAAAAAVEAAAAALRAVAASSDRRSCCATSRRAPKSG